MKLEVLMEHREHMPNNYSRAWFEREVLFKFGRIEAIGASEDYFQLPLDVGIINVKTDEQLKEMIAALALVDSVGVDTESYAFVKNHSVELVQIATKDEVYLIRKKHVQDLSLDLRVEAGYVLGMKQIVFFASKNDSTHLNVFFPNIDIMNTLDIQILVDKLKVIVLGKNGKPKPHISLSDCTQECLGKPLRKDHTMSNWATSGVLSHNQTVYAALDAWVLVPILEAYKNNPKYSHRINTAIADATVMSVGPDNLPPLAD